MIPISGTLIPCNIYILESQYNINFIILRGCIPKKRDFSQKIHSYFFLINEISISNLDIPNLFKFYFYVYLNRRYCNLFMACLIKKSIIWCLKIHLFWFFLYFHFGIYKKHDIENLYWNAIKFYARVPKLQE